MICTAPYPWLMTEEDIHPFFKPTNEDTARIQVSIITWRIAAKERYKNQPEYIYDPNQMRVFHEAYGRTHADRFMSLAEYLDQWEIVHGHHYCAPKDGRMLPTSRFPVPRILSEMVQDHHGEFMNACMRVYGEMHDNPIRIEPYISTEKKRRFQFMCAVMYPIESLVLFCKRKGTQWL